MIRQGEIVLNSKRHTLDVRVTFFIERVVMRWNSLPRRVVDASSLEVFSIGLGGALCYLI